MDALAAQVGEDLRDYTGVLIGKGRKVKDPEIQRELDRLWDAWGTADPFLRDLSHGMSRITQGEIPNGSGTSLGGGITPADVAAGFQPLDADLTSIAALSGTGLLARTATDTWGLRSLAAPLAGLTISNNDGVSGNPTFALANDLSALEGLGSTGFAVRTTTDVWAQRSIAVTAANGGIAVSNGDGVSGNPTLSLDADLETIAGITSGGILCKTGASPATTWAVRAISVPTGMSITNPAGISGTITISLANDLAALEGLGSTGLAVRTTTDTWDQRSIAVGSAKLTVSNGSGVSGNPTLDLGAALFTERATQNLTAASQTVVVTDTEPVTPITANGAYTLSAAPTIANGRDGQLAILFNTGTTNLVFQDMGTLGGSNLRLTSATRTLNAGCGVMALIYDTTMGGWVEQYLSNVLAFTASVSGFTIDGSSAATREVAAASTADATPSFAISYVGVPSTASINIDAGGGEISGSDYPITVPSPYTSLTSGTSPPSKAFYRGTSVSQVRTFTVTATISGTAGLTRTCTVTYINRRYAGPNSQSTLLSSAQVLGLDGVGGTSDLNTSQYGTFTVTTTTGEYIWYAHRSALTAVVVVSGGTGQISISGEIAGFSDMGTISHTNDLGFVETFRLYRSTNTNFGSGKSVVTASSARTNRIYMGPSTDTNPISTANILALDDTANGTSNLNGAVGGSYAVTITGSNYLWFCHPDRYPDLATIKDNSTGFAIAGSYRTDVSHTNDFGYVETYRCWRSDNVGIFPSGGTVVVT